MAFSVVSFTAFLPSTPILRMLPNSVSFQVTYTMLLLSAVKVGSASKSVPLVKRFGVPLGSVLVQRYPKALKTKVFPSGEVTASRIIFTVKSVSEIGVLKCTLSATSIATSTVNGILVALKVLVLILLILPPNQITISSLLGIQLKLGYTPNNAQAVCWSLSSLSNIGHSSPVSKSCKYKTELVPILLTKANFFPSGETCGRPDHRWWFLIFRFRIRSVW